MSKPNIVILFMIVIAAWINGYAVNNNNAEAKIAGYACSAILAFVAAVAFLNT